MQPTRRDILRLGLGSMTLLAGGGVVPVFLANAARAIALQPQRSERILVVVQLDGGNDGLNTVVPFRDDAYRRLRPRLRLPDNRLHRLNDDMALHQNLDGLKGMFDDRKLAIVQSVGYPNPNRSHFESMAIWHTARLNPERGTPGWLARCLDHRLRPRGGDSSALHVSTELLPQALYGSQQHVPSLADLEQFRRRLGIADERLAAAQRTALDQIASQQSGVDGSLLQFVERTSTITYTSSARLEAVLGQSRGSAQYPEFYPLARRLKLIAQLIKAGMQTSIYYTQIGGFDTHANQLGTHAGLLQQLDDSVHAFVDDLSRTEHGERVLVLVFSEFGRRLQENASLGTDHGTAAPVFLIGPGIHPGLHGPNPNLRDLVDGDPQHAIDFRSVYAAILDNWLGCPSADILGAPFEQLNIVRT